MDGQARLLVYLQGHIDEERMARAVRLTLDAEPMLRYRFVDDARRPHWELVEERDWSMFFRRFDRPTSSEELFAFMTEPVPPERAPQIRVGLFRSEDDTLCIRSNHLTMDGGGAVQYLSLLSLMYRELERTPDHRPLPNPPVRPRPHCVLTGECVLRGIRALPKLRPPGAEWGISPTSDDLSGRAFTIRQIGPERLQGLRSYAREMGVTVNDVLLAAFCRALFTVADPPRYHSLRVEVPTNLRRYLPAEQARSIGDLSAVYFLNIDRRDEGLEQTVRRVHCEIDRKKRDRSELAGILLLELVLIPGAFALRKLKERSGFRVAHPVLSNLGVIDENKADFGSVPVKDVLPIGPVLYPPNVALGVTTFRQRMTLSINYCDTAVDPRTMDRLLDLILDELPGKPIHPNGREMQKMATAASTLPAAQREEAPSFAGTEEGEDDKVG